MKEKLFILLLAALLLLSLVSCGGKANDPGDTAGNEPAVQDEPNKESQNDAPDSDDSEKIDIPDSSDTEDTEKTDEPQVSPVPEEPSVPETPEFQPNEDLTVITGFVYDRDTYILLENTGESPILDYSVAYMTFDKNGFLTTTEPDGYELGRSDAANLMPGDKALPSWFGGDGNYVAATVSHIKYADGTEWDAKYLDVWASDTKSSFNKDDYSATLSSLKEVGNQALSCEYASLSNVTLVHGNRFSSDFDLQFTITNTGTQGIATIRLFIMEFDANGFPVPVSPYDTYCLNGHTTGGSVNLVPGDAGTFTDDLFADGSTTQLKSVIYSITFQDGSEWFNPYIYEYIIANNSAY